MALSATQAFSGGAQIIPLVPEVISILLETYAERLAPIMLIQCT